jgi:hypothetical protein
MTTLEDLSERWLIGQLWQLRYSYATTAAILDTIGNGHIFTTPLLRSIYKAMRALHEENLKITVARLGELLPQTTLLKYKSALYECRHHYIENMTLESTEIHVKRLKEKS